MKGAAVVDAVRAKKAGKIKGRGTVAASRHCLHKGSGGTRKIARAGFPASP
jgi:hypothetical protein